MLINTKRKIKLNFHNRLNATNSTGKLCKIEKEKIICTVENMVLNGLIHVSISHLYNYFISEAF